MTNQAWSECETPRLAAAISGAQSRCPTSHPSATCARKMRMFADLAEKLKIPVEDLMRQANGKVSPSKALVKGVAKELVSARRL